MKALGDRALVEAVLADWRTAPIDERLRAALGFLERSTLDPGGIGPEDAERARRAGVSDAALDEALRVAFVFDVMDRLADTLDFSLTPDRTIGRVAAMLLRVGYGIASLPGG